MTNAQASANNNPDKGALAAISLRDVLLAVGFALILIDQIAALTVIDLHNWVYLFSQLGYPLLFFMVGFEHRRDIPLIWIAGGVIITVVNLLLSSGQVTSLFPVSVLLTLAASRFLLPYVWGIAWRRIYYFWYVLLLLFFAGFIARWAFEYGTLGLLFMLAGDATRRREEVDERIGRQAVSVMIGLIFLGMLALHTIILGLNILQVILFAAGLAGIWWVVTQYDLNRPVNVSNGLRAPILHAVWFYIAGIVIFRCGYAIVSRLSYMLA